MTRPRVLLVGGSGQLGTELRRQAADLWEITAPPRAAFDAETATGLPALMDEVRPHLVVNASAFHVVDLCESAFARALQVNAVTVHALAKVAESAGARLVTISTDYAFDGNSRLPYGEDDLPNPIQAYGVSKVAGEMAALSAHPEGAIVVRTCGLYGRAPSRQKAGNFVLNRLADARAHAEIEVGSDLVCTPTSASDLASALIRLVEAGAPGGRYHLTNSGQCDWATFAAEIMRLAGLATRVVPVDRQGAYAPARRPAFSVLACTKAASLGVTLRPWQDALSDYVRTTKI
jgi:dTDP-4-dehydrorhamnose reductase